MFTQCCMSTHVHTQDLAQMANPKAAIKAKRIGVWVCRLKLCVPIAEAGRGAEEVMTSKLD